MAYMTFEEWGAANPNDSNPYNNYYNNYLTGPDPQYQSPGYGGGGTAPSVTPYVPQEYNLPPGIPAYQGYKPTDYGKTTPNSAHWLNTMNAFAPQARTDMQRLLGANGGNGSAPYQPQSGNNSWNISPIGSSGNPYQIINQMKDRINPNTTNQNQSPVIPWGSPNYTHATSGGDDFGPLPIGGLNNPDGTVAFIKADGTVGYKYSDGKLYEPGGLLDGQSDSSGGLLK